MIYPINDDKRYTISREWTGREKPDFVARFCEEWIGASASPEGAIRIAIEESAKRKAALRSILVIEELLKS